MLFSVSVYSDDSLVKVRPLYIVISLFISISLSLKNVKCKEDIFLNFKNDVFKSKFISKIFVLFRHTHRIFVY